jgi:hypothetical protein
MNGKHVRFHPDFARDLKIAIQYYDVISEMVGARFRTEIQTRIDLIVSQPEAFACVHKNVRAARTKKFPYVVLYRSNDTVVEFVGLVLGSSQRENWFNRGS